MNDISFIQSDIHVANFANFLRPCKESGGWSNCYNCL